MRLQLLACAAATLAVAAVAAGPISAARHDSPPPLTGVEITPVAQGTIPARVHVRNAGIDIKTKGPRTMLVTSMKVEPGGSFGWHTHPGPVLVAISKGALAVYEAHGARCIRSSVGAGTAFIEDGRDVHLARNEGTEPVELSAIFFARTDTTQFLTPAPEPSACHL